MLSTPAEKVNRNGSPRAVVLFPGSLGDFLCLLPALDVIRRTLPGGRVEAVVRGDALEMARQLLWIGRLEKVEIQARLGGAEVVVLALPAADRDDD